MKYVERQEMIHFRHIFGAWLVTMVIPSLDQEITAALALVQMVLTVDASLPGAVIKTLLLSRLHVFVILGTLV
ncbi:hypothetical protein A6R68_03658, partial [Neotoma lepida]